MMGIAAVGIVGTRKARAVEEEGGQSKSIEEGRQEAAY